MWIWQSATDLWEPDPAAPLDGFQGNLLGIAFSPSNPALGYAVGTQGTLLRYDKTWTQETLPADVAGNNLTSVAFAGGQALVAAGSNVLENNGSGWTVDQGVRTLLASLPNKPSILAVAGLPDGGAIAAGHDVVLERDSLSSPWRVSDQPLPGRHRRRGRGGPGRRAGPGDRLGPAAGSLPAGAPDGHHRPEFPTAAAPAQPAAGVRLPPARDGERLGRRRADLVREPDRGQAGQDRPDRGVRPRQRRKRLGRRGLERSGRRERTRQLGLRLRRSGGPRPRLDLRDLSLPALGRVGAGADRRRGGTGRVPDVAGQLPRRRERRVCGVVRRSPRRAARPGPEPHADDERRLEPHQPARRTAVLLYTGGRLESGTLGAADATGSPSCSRLSRASRVPGGLGGRLRRRQRLRVLRRVRRLPGAVRHRRRADRCVDRLDPGRRIGDRAACARITRSTAPGRPEPCASS